MFWESLLIVISWFEKIDWTVYFFISYSFILDNKILKLFQLDLPSPFIQREDGLLENFLWIGRDLIQVRVWKYIKKGGYTERGNHTPLSTIWYAIVSVYLSFTALLSGWRVNVWSIQWKGKTASDGHTDDIIRYTLDNILRKTNPPKPISHRIIGSEIDKSKWNEQY